MTPSTDFIVRMVEQLSGFMARIAELIVSGRLFEAEIQADYVVGTLTGLDRVDELPASEEDFLRFVESLGAPDRAIALSMLLIQKAHAAQRACDPERFDSCFRRAYAAASAPSVLASADEPGLRGIGEQLRYLDPHGLSPEHKLLLHRFHKLARRWAPAEDILYFLRDEDGWDARDALLAFYGELLGKTDKELETGNLPRLEVEEALLALDEKA